MRPSIGLNSAPYDSMVFVGVWVADSASKLCDCSSFEFWAAASVVHSKIHGDDCIGG